MDSDLMREKAARSIYSNFSTHSLNHHEIFPDAIKKVKEE